MGLVGLWHVGSSQIRVQTHVPHIGRQIPNHWSTREVRQFHFWSYYSLFLIVHLGQDWKSLVTPASVQLQTHLLFLISSPTLICFLVAFGSTSVSFLDCRFLWGRDFLIHLLLSIPKSTITCNKCFLTKYSLSKKNNSTPCKGQKIETSEHVDIFIFLDSCLHQWLKKFFRFPSLQTPFSPGWSPWHARVKRTKMLTAWAIDRISVSEENRPRKAWLCFPRNYARGCWC